MRLRLKVTPMRRRRRVISSASCTLLVRPALMPVVVATGVLCEEEAALAMTRVRAARNRETPEERFFTACSQKSRGMRLARWPSVTIAISFQFPKRIWEGESFSEQLS